MQFLVQVNTEEKFVRVEDAQGNCLLRKKWEEEDSWFGFKLDDDDFDLHVDAEGHPCVTIHPVVNGNTNVLQEVNARVVMI